MASVCKLIGQRAEHKRMERVTQTLQKASRLNLARVSTTRSQRNHKVCQFYHKVVQVCQCMILSHIRLLSLLSLLFLFSLWNTLKIFEVFLGWLKGWRVAELPQQRALFSCHYSGVPIETLALPPGTQGEELTSRGWAESRNWWDVNGFRLFFFASLKGSMSGLIISVTVCYC